MQILVETLLQNEVTLERTNSAVYRQMADELDNMGWGGSAKFMRLCSSILCCGMSELRISNVATHPAA